MCPVYEQNVFGATASSSGCRRYVTFSPVTNCCNPVASLGGADRPASRRVTPEGKKICVGKFTKNSGETRSDVT